MRMIMAIACGWSTNQGTLFSGPALLSTNQGTPCSGFAVSSAGDDDNEMENDLGLPTPSGHVGQMAHSNSAAASMANENDTDISDALQRLDSETRK